MPPQPGSIPRLVSGRPIAALDEITRRSQARQISKPPPRAKPLIVATEGYGRSSISENSALTTCAPAIKSSLDKENMALNSVISAPTTNTDLPLESSSPLIPFCCLSISMACRSSPRVSSLNLLTEPLWLSNLISAKSLSSLARLSVFPSNIRCVPIICIAVFLHRPLF